MCVCACVRTCVCARTCTHTRIRTHSHTRTRAHTHHIHTHTHTRNTSSKTINMQPSLSLCHSLFGLRYKYTGTHPYDNRCPTEKLEALIDATDVHGRDCLFIAKQFGEHDCVEALIKYVPSHILKTKLHQLISDGLWEDDKRFVKNHLRVQGTSSEFFAPKDHPRESDEIFQEVQDKMKALQSQGPLEALLRF